MNEIPILTNANIVYWLIITIAMLISAVTLGQLWKRHENHRWTLGYVIVFLGGAIMVYLRHWDLNTWGGLLFAVGISGAIKISVQRYRDSIEAERIRDGQTSRQ